MSSLYIDRLCHYFRGVMGILGNLWNHPVIYSLVYFLTKGINKNSYLCVCDSKESFKYRIMFKFLFVMFFFFILLVFLMGSSILRTFKNIFFW